MNRLPTSPDEFDRSLRRLQQQADATLSPATLARLRAGRRQASTATAHSPWRRRGWWLATACSAVFAVTVALHFNTPAPPPASAAVDDLTTDDTLLLEQSPELYLWLGSDTLAME